MNRSSLLRFAAIGASLLALAACTPLGALNATIPTDGVTILRDVPYMQGARGGMDIYRPASAAGPLPMTVFFYGGSWRSGNRADYLFLATALARAGMVVVVPDYRLHPEAQFPDYLADAARAVAAARAGAAAWGADPERLALAGHSAGAWIAAMLALDPRYLAAAGDSRAHLTGVVGIAGPYDFLPIESPRVRAVFAAATDQRTTQPITYADGAGPPMLLLHGADDDIVEPRNSTILARRIKAAGGTADVRIYPGTGHIGILSSFAPLLRDGSPALADTARFILGLTPAK